MPTETEKLEGLMMAVINHLSEAFGAHAILKGGMCLRLLDCPRFTNDLDYVFIPYKSKGTVAPDIIRVLNAMPDVEVSHSLNSKCLRCRLRRDDVLLQVEVQVAEKCPSTDLSTVSLAHVYGAQPRIIRVMNFETALAHKVAAWNERRLMRDLYDIHYLFTIMGTMPAMDILLQRLQTVQSRRNRNRSVNMSLSELIAEIEREAAGLNQRQIDQELRDVLGHEDRVGLDLKLRISMHRLCEHLKTFSPGAGC